MQIAIGPTSGERSPRPNPGRLLFRLVFALAGAVLLTAGATACLIAFSHHTQWWSAWAAALAVSTVAAVLALAPLVPGLFAGVQFAAYGYLAGAVLRMIASLLGGLAAVLVFRTSAAPTLLLLAPLYLAQVTAESVVLGRAFWPRATGKTSPT